MADDSFKKSALTYHQHPKPGKIAITATKPMTTARDLALAYSPGVAIPCEEIAEDPLKAYDYTSRGNMVAVISNGTAVLGLGAIGALASKPVMEGKAVLFKKFADIDSIDLEINETDVDKLVDIIAPLEPSFGGINLEDIKAPECFEVEKKLRERMNIPVFHDDQHGTAIIVAAAFRNWLRLANRKIEDIRLVTSGAGASAIACLNLLVAMGLPKSNIVVCDRQGVIYKGREGEMDPYKASYASDTNARDLADAIEGADMFLGLSAKGALKPEMVEKMADEPLIMALANPTPEIMPEEAKAAKPDCIVCTGRSDFPNQVNNVLCFPFIFRGALDVGATTINEEMKIACVHAIADLAMEAASHEVASVYADENLTFGPEYMIPKPFDPRLIMTVPIAVAKAAMETGVASRPIQDFDAYQAHLQQTYYRSDQLMRPVFEKARHDPKRIAFAEGEEERVLRAVQTIVEENLAKPILIGRRRVIEARIKKLNLKIRDTQHFEICDPEDDPRYREYWSLYHSIMERRGVTPDVAKNVLRTNNTVIAALMVHRNEADTLVCGTVGQYTNHLQYLHDIIGLRPGVETAAALAILITNHGNLFITDTHVNPDPSCEQIAEVTLLAAEEMKRFGVEPKIALLSRSNFGTHDSEDAMKMRRALTLVKERSPELEIDGEMHADAALSSCIREQVMPHSTLKGQANLLVMPSVSSANITYNTVKTITEATVVGPILLGVAKPVHIVTTAATPRGLINIAALASVEAQFYDAQHKADTSS